ncbi:MAG TPA: 3-keto-5-aminohexanoate cleavage protein [Kiloniellales bacterium]|nr:3-keto-5-aminohexanoate cleavage protein [Kiloniellales bacterium]
MTGTTPDTAWTPMILAVAPNGARKTQADHPAIPIAPEEIGRCAAACAESGAAMIHLHVRNRDGGHTLDPDAYRAAIAAVRRETGDRVIVQATSESVGLYQPAEQMAMVRALKPEAVSLAVREFAPDAASEATAAAFFAWVARERILAQYILYSDEDLMRFDDLIARGVVPPGPHFVLFVLGRYTAGQRSQPGDLLPFVAANRSDHAWAMCAFGPRETACAIVAGGLGGHARVGFENNMHLPDGTLAPDNAALVAAVADGARSIGRPLADAATAREIMAAAHV